MKILEIDQVQHLYPSKPPRHALRGVTLSVEKGQIFGLLGPNGSGKTTLFKILSTTFKPTSGQVKILGIDVVNQPEKVRKKIGVVFQSPSLDLKCSARENIRYHGYLYGWRGNDLERRIMEVLDSVGLGDRADDLAGVLSGGQKRRLEIAKGLLSNPELLLMDEPSTGLDPGARRDLWVQLQNLQKMGMTIVLTTHLMEEAERCDRLAIFNQGTCVAEGTPEQLRREIGGDVITLEVKNPTEMMEKISQQFQIKAEIIDGKLRFEIVSGHTFVPKLGVTFPNEIQSINLSKPTLEDVFIHRTGHTFWSTTPPPQSINISQVKK